jgi:signal transduction histidine kinase
MLQQAGRVDAAPSATHASILVVEDDELLSDAVASVLRERGHCVERCSDALDALARLNAGDVPDMILLDLVMPRMNGWEFRIAQRSHPGLFAIPVIAMSASSAAEAVAIDADYFLHKPFSSELLLEAVERVLAASRQKREQARQAELERLSALGVLAAGISHEINNPLTFVTGNLELASSALQRLEVRLQRRERQELAAIRVLVDKADQGAQRIAAVVRNVSAFARPSTDVPEAVNVREVLEESIELVAHEIRHHAALVCEHGELPPVMASRTKLEQVFLNLLTNALHVIRDSPGRAHQIRVATSHTPAGVVVSVSDTGAGIPAAMVPRIFDPFFPTKASGVGTGLGLAICHRLVSAMGGTLSVESGAEGSTFRVVLPVTELAAPAHASGAGVLPAERGALKPRLLVIDDEKLMCDLLVAMLGEDYRVSTEVSARSALAQLCAGEVFDVILCDLMMPDFSGMDLHAELSRVCPDQAARMVFMTGGTFTPRTTEFLERLENGHVHKPFIGTELDDALQRLLRQRGAASPAGAARSVAPHT